MTGAAAGVPRPPSCEVAGVARKTCLRLPAGVRAVKVGCYAGWTVSLVGLGFRPGRGLSAHDGSHSPDLLLERHLGPARLRRAGSRDRRAARRGRCPGSEVPRPRQDPPAQGARELLHPLVARDGDRGPQPDPARDGSRDRCNPVARARPAALPERARQADGRPTGRKMRAGQRRGPGHRRRTACASPAWPSGSPRCSDGWDSCGCSGCSPSSKLRDVVVPWDIGGPARLHRPQRPAQRADGAAGQAAPGRPGRASSAR